MTTIVEVFADITCPFTHLGLGLVTERLSDANEDVEVRVRAWPLEWVNGVPLDVTSTAAKIETLREQLGTERFSGFRPDRWPHTMIPALNLAAAAYAQGPSTGLEVSLELRNALFEQGRDISDPAILAPLADDHRLPHAATEAGAAVTADYAEGRRRGVTGSPHFWVDDQNYFCPSLDVGHDPAGDLTAAFDEAGLTEFMAGLANRPG
ncbi:MAG: DsbA family protein [Acidimicrobiales bacterium]